jgi:hypothetical protein
MKKPATYTRPMPPDHLRRMVVDFARAYDVEALVREEFVNRRGIYFDPEHGHLASASIGVLWASSAHVDRGSEKAGTAQLVKQAEPRKWGDAIRHRFMADMFGINFPDFLITLSAPHCAIYSDREFFALLDHELSHCGTAKDEYGAPRFNDSGRPVYTIRPHDHEGFVGTTERWGAHASGAAGLAAAAAKQPRFAWVPGKDLDLRVCGT